MTEGPVDENPVVNEDGSPDRLEQALTDLSRWRAEALRRAVTTRPSDQAELARLHQRVAQLEAELEAQHRTLSWRITRPLRAARRLAR